MMSVFYRLLFYIVFISASCSSAWSGELIGLWQEYNDDTGKAEALIRIEKTADNRYQGRIEKILPDTAENVSLVCSLCNGSLHNQPLLGLRILSGLQRKDSLTFAEGEITDPDDGKSYRCNIRLSEDGNTLEVTGYLTFNWIGHSEIWRRVK